jgi:hypothetical protein
LRLRCGGGAGSGMTRVLRRVDRPRRHALTKFGWGLDTFALRQTGLAFVGVAFAPLTDIPNLKTRLMILPILSVAAHRPALFDGAAG